MVVTVLGKIAILILYGKQYLEATAPLGILIWATGFAMIGTARGIWIVAEGSTNTRNIMFSSEPQLILL